MKKFLLTCGVVLLTPLAWRIALAAIGPADGAPPSYLPALERTRERKPFDEGVVQGLQRMNPGIVIIGDSMAGRIDFAHLGHLTKETIAPILRNATGSGYWYLAFKNYVVASGTHPKWTLVFFRDTNLTDPLFRLAEPNRDGLDEAATDYEDELNEVVAARNTGAWRAVHRLTDRAYAVERTRAWLEPALAGWPARVVAGSDGGADLLASMNEAFSRKRLRPIPRSDIDADADRRADFYGNVAQSVLPLFIKLSREAKVPLCFVRVLRRPVNGEPPPESRALAQYAVDLRRFLDEEGVAYLDDRDDPRLHTIEYADGDHIARGELARYTAILVERLSRLNGRLLPAPAPVSRVGRTCTVVLQTAGMFVLVTIGWLMFRETDTGYLFRDLTLSPWSATTFDRQAGAYLFLLTCIYSVPLWIDSVWAVYVRPRLDAERFAAITQRPAWFMGQSVLAGLALAMTLVFRSRQSLDFIYFQF